MPHMLPLVARMCFDIMLGGVITGVITNVVPAGTRSPAITMQVARGLVLKITLA